MPNAWPKVRLRPERYEQMMQESFMQGCSLAQVIEDALEAVYPRNGKPVKKTLVKGVTKPVAAKKATKRPPSRNYSEITPPPGRPKKKAAKQAERPTRRLRRVP